MYKYICILLAAAAAALLIWGTSVTRKPYAQNDVVLVMKKLGEDISKELALEFKMSEVNTVELEFKDAVSARVRIFNGDVLIYERSGTEKYRFCSFATVRTSSLKVVSDVPAVVKNVRVSHCTSENSEFRVTAYAVASTVADGENVKVSDFDVITDVILFGCVTFDENGELSADKELLEKSLGVLKNAADGKDVRFYVNVLGPDSQSDSSDWNEQMNDKAERHSKAFKNKALPSELAKLAKEYGLNGVFFDYEYPLKRKYWNDFDRFIRKVRSELGEGKIGLAVSEWNLQTAGDALFHADMLELMEYDAFDENGHHSSFETFLKGHNAVKKRGVALKDVDFGLPFYGRPADSGAYWPSYKEYAQALGTADDCTDTEFGLSYFNCRQTVYDKTAYALANDIGGIMVWHYACDATDDSLSLFGAMKECIEDRKVK